MTTATDVPAIEITGLRKSFGDHEVLKGIDLSVLPGEVVCVIGPSGSGKSTLLRTVNRLEEPTSGSLRIEGVDILDPDCDIDAVRTRIGMVFQQFNLFPNMKVMRNITEAPVHVLGMAKDEAEARARELLELVGLTEHIDKYPTQLSGGQQQRVAIARALAMRPQVLLLDEVTSALDPELVAGVLDLLRDIAQTTDITMLCVTHEMNFARDISDDVLMFDAGKIIESGPPEKIFSEPEEERTQQFLNAIL